MRVWLFGENLIQIKQSICVQVEYGIVGGRCYNSVNKERFVTRNKCSKYNKKVMVNIRVYMHQCVVGIHQSDQVGNYPILTKVREVIKFLMQNMKHMRSVWNKCIGG